MNEPVDSGAPPWAVELLHHVEQLAARVAELEGAHPAARRPAPALAQPEAAAPPEPPRPEVTEEDMVYIAAAVAAYLGVRARIRQVRLVQSSAWAQVGRATIHASHRVH
jgi:methylmalonyl-CoA carboxyltransferase large subunit